MRTDLNDNIEGQSSENDTICFILLYEGLDKE